MTSPVIPRLKLPTYNQANEHIKHGQLLNELFIVCMKRVNVEALSRERTLSAFDDTFKCVRTPGFVNEFLPNKNTTFSSRRPF